ncbi:MAG: DUF3574 domain-containing protein [Lachnospiraceae bacterium]|nr:DUF3574 domain-containing protein [Lachnospiraceae bacterium]
MKGYKNVVTGIALSAAMAFCLTGCSEAELKQIGAAVDARIDERIEAALSERDALNAENEDIQYVLFLGTNDKDTNEPVFTPEEAKEKAEEILIERLGGYTIQEANGGWKSDDGTVFQEYSLVIYLSDIDSETVHETAEVLRKEFNQSTVMIQENRTKTEFYNGEE